VRTLVPALVKVSAGSSSHVPPSKTGRSFLKTTVLDSRGYLHQSHFPHGGFKMPFILAAGPYPVRKPFRKTTCEFRRHPITFRTMDNHQVHRIGDARVAYFAQQRDQASAPLTAN
jgi:hypothetical protein